MNWVKLVKFCAIGITILEALSSICDSMARNEAKLEKSKEPKTEND
jgi:hypothetical protein